MPDPVRTKKLASGQVTLYNPTTQELILLDVATAAQFTAADKGNEWGKAISLIASGGAGGSRKLSRQDLQSVQEAMSFVVLLNGSNDWPP